MKGYLDEKIRRYRENDGRWREIIEFPRYRGLASYLTAIKRKNYKYYGWLRFIALIFVAAFPFLLFLSLHIEYLQNVGLNSAKLLT